MKALRIALSLVRIPRLFATLFLVPIFLSLIIVYVQLVATGVALRAVTAHKNEAVVEQVNKEPKDILYLRRILFGTKAKLPAPLVCRWVKRTDPDGRIREYPPGPECAPDRLDAALHVADPQTFDPRDYLKAFDGSLLRLHLCATCHPDIVIDKENGVPKAHAFSLPGLLVLGMVNFNDEARGQFVEASRNMERVLSMFGDVFFHVKDFRKPIKINELETALALIFNIAFLIVVALWLALKAHRKVLDYFSKNGALLPMVAATGKSSFYSAIWILTGLRVACFLVAAAPVSWYAFDTLTGADNAMSMLSGDKVEFKLWIIALTAGLGMATMVASISDLKQRSSFLSFTYRYVPLIVSLLGGLIWLLSFLIETPFFGWLRAVITALPLLGLSPILVAPVFQPQLALLIIHAVLTLFLTVVILRANARWFAAHLEEL